MRYISLLKKLANQSTHEDHPMACLIVKKNRIISTGFNQVKTCPNSGHKYKHIHCEYDALRRLTAKETKGCTAYIYRENKDGVLSNAKPCESCRILLKKFLIGRIIYSYEGFWKEETLYEI